MAIGSNQWPGTEGKWDMAHLVGNTNNLMGAFGGGFKLTPTALLPANWVLYHNGSGACAKVWDIEIVSDTAIEWQLYFNSGTGDPGFAAQTTNDIASSGHVAAWKFEAEVKAAVAHGNFITGGFLAPNQPYHIFNKTWYRLPVNSGFNLVTALTAANVYATFYWLEMLD